MPLTPNTTILDGKYNIIRRLGKGAFAHVWLADDRHVGQQVAIKELRSSELSQQEFTDFSRRLQREAKVGRLVRHPNIVEVYTVERWHDDLLLVMEYVEGQTIRERLNRDGPLPLEIALGITMQVCDALDVVHTHSLGIVHRDIKPSNIMLGEAAEARVEAKLIDFGLAQLAGESERSLGGGRHHPGTPLYMAPEQESTFGYLAPAADIYALGLTSGEMLIGDPVKPRLLQGEAWADLLGKQPTWLADALQKATAADWRERYRRAGELKSVLEKHVRAPHDANENDRQQRLSRLYTAAQTAARDERWKEVLKHSEAIAALDPHYRDILELRAMAEAGLRAQLESGQRRSKKGKELAAAYKALETALRMEQWNAVLKHCDEIDQLRPGSRVVQQARVHAQGRLRQQALEQEQQRQQQKLVEAYDEVKRAFRTERWQAVIKHCDNIMATDATYRDVPQLRNQAEERLRAEEEAHARRDREKQTRLRQRLAAEGTRAIEGFRLGEVATLREELMKVAPLSPEASELRPVPVLVRACLSNWTKGVRCFRSGELLRYLSEEPELVKHGRRLRKQWREAPEIGLLMLLSSPKVLEETQEEDRKELERRLIAEGRKAVQAVQLDVVSSLGEALERAAPGSAEARSLNPITALVSGCLSNWPEGEHRFRSGELLQWLSEEPELVKHGQALRKRWESTPTLGLALLLSHPDVTDRMGSNERMELVRRLDAQGKKGIQGFQLDMVTAAREGLENIAPGSSESKSLRPIPAVVGACLSNWAEGEQRFQSGELLKWLEAEREMERHGRRLQKKWKKSPGLGLVLLLSHPQIAGRMRSDERVEVIRRLAMEQAKAAQDEQPDVVALVQEASNSVAWLERAGTRSN